MTKYDDGKALAAGTIASLPDSYFRVILVYQFRSSYKCEL